MAGARICSRLYMRLSAPVVFQIAFIDNRPGLQVYTYRYNRVANLQFECRALIGK
jgi:hypothetical protein